MDTDWETSLTARYQTDSQTIKCIQYPSLKFFCVFKVFFTKSPYDNGHFHPNVIHLTAVEIPGVAPKTQVPHRGQKQQQNNMLSSTKKKKKSDKKTKLHHTIVPEWHKPVKVWLCFFIFLFFLFFGLIRKWTVLHVASQVIKISLQFRTLNHTYKAAALFPLGS